MGRKHSQPELWYNMFNFLGIQGAVGCPALSTWYDPAISACPQLHSQISSWNFLLNFSPKQQRHMYLKAATHALNIQESRVWG